MKPTRDAVRNARSMRPAVPDTRSAWMTSLRTVDVRACVECFGGPEIDKWKWLRCRKGEALERSFIERLLISELAARPGWLSFGEYLSRKFRADRQKRETRATPETDGARP